MPEIATFTCAECGGQAGSVELIAPGVRDTRLGGPIDAPPGIDELASDDYRLSITGPVSVTISPVAPEPLRKVIADSDGAGLYVLDREFAPFWCRECAAPYCRDHFTQIVEYDDGFFDAIYGTCPNGHRRVLSD